MLGIQEFWLFILSGLLLNVTPGPDTAYILGRSIQLGWRGGAAAAIGICTGCLVHVFGAAIGLSALLMASSTAFAVLKLAGAAYLLFIGVQMLLSRPQAAGRRRASWRRDIAAESFLAGRTYQRAQSEGGAVLSRLPAAICRGGFAAQGARLPALGGVFIFNSTLWCLGIAAFAAGAAFRIRRSEGVMVWINRVLGGLFVYLGFRVAMMEAR